MHKKREVIGLTGGIASGKSTVAQMFMAEGVPVLDTDSIAREVSKEASMQAVIIAAFGRDSVQNGELNRQYLTSIIFADDAKRQKLNDIMHPAIKQVVTERLAHYKEGLIVVDVPLMYETDFYTLMDKVIIVYVPEAVQVERLMQREHLTEADALLRLKAQMPLAEKVKKADYILDNTQSEATLYLEFKKLYKELTAVKAERSR